jgi:hypothetical protein
VTLGHEVITGDGLSTICLPVIFMPKPSRLCTAEL